jgi:hypothetical protein
VHISSKLFEAVDATVAEWKRGTPAGKLDTKKYSTNEWLRFLHTLPDSLSAEKMKELDDSFHFTSSGNSEILFAWFELCIRSHYLPAYGAMEQFLIQVGRRKFVMPLFKALVKTRKEK